MNDLISRQAVIDCFKKWQPYMATRLHEFENELSELPTIAISHDGDLISRKDAIEFFKYDVYIVNELKNMATVAIPSAEPCDDAISREAVEDKLNKMCNALEEIFANIRLQNADESVCGLCEYDCPAPFECKGFETNECFKLADEIRHKWQSTKDIPPVNPQPKTGNWIRVTDNAGHLVWECDKCGWQQRYNTNFCPDCGADMRGDTDADSD